MHTMISVLIIVLVPIAAAGGGIYLYVTEKRKNAA